MSHTNMAKRRLTTDQLVEADFRQIQKLMVKKHGKEFTLDYIRKVCKGKRTNDNILNMAKKYQQLSTEMKSKIDHLST